MAATLTEPLLRGMSFLGGFLGDAGGRRTPPAEDADFVEEVERLRRAASRGDVGAVRSVLKQQRRLERQRRDDVLMRVLKEAVTTRDSATIALLEESGASLDTMDWQGETVLEYALGAYRESSDRGLLELIGYLAMHCNTIRTLQQLRLFVRVVEVAPADLEALCRCLVAGSQFPVTTALEVAEFFKFMAGVNVVESEQYMELSTSFTHTAQRLVNDIESDHLAAVVLEEKDPLGKSPISVALASYNTQFIGDGRVTRVVNTLWSQPDFMKQGRFSAEAGGFAHVVQLIIAHPKAFFLLPVGKFLIEAFSFFIFLFLYSYVVHERIGLGDHIHPSEVLLWIFVCAFVLNEANEALDSTFAEYVGQGYNLLDMTIYFSFVVIAGLRIHFHKSEVDTDSEPSVAYRALTAVTIILLWLRVSFIFVIHPTVGPLLRAMSRMLTDVKNFAVLMVLFMAGFSLAFFFLIDSQLPNFTHITNTVLSLFRSTVGDSAFGDFDDLPYHTKIFADVFLVAYIIITSIILLNTLIAMLSESYGTIQEQSILQFNFGRTELTVSLDQENNELPPPFNVLVLLTYALWRFGEIAYLLASGKGERTEDSWLPQPEPLDSEVSIGDWYASKRVSDAAAFAAAAGGGSPRDYRELQENEQRRERADSEQVATEDTTVPPFYCGFCHHLNVATTYKKAQDVLRQRLLALKSVGGRAGELDEGRASKSGRLPTIEEKKVDTDALADTERDPVDIIDDATVVCVNCFRVRKPLEPLEKRMEDISFVWFMLLLYVPIFLLLFVPYVVVALGERALAIVERRHRQRQSELVHKNIKEQERARRKREALSAELGESAVVAAEKNRKRDWVKSRFYEPPATLDDVLERVEQLHERLKKLKRGHEEAPPAAAAAAPAPQS